MQDGTKRDVQDVFHKNRRSREMLLIQLSGKFSRVQLDSLEALLRPIEQPDKDVRFGCIIDFLQ